MIARYFASTAGLFAGGRRMRASVVQKSLTGKGRDC
jgi:hypothetical protein